MAEALGHLFTTKNKSTLKWSEIFASLRESTIATYVEEKEYKKQLNQLH